MTFFITFALVVLLDQSSKALILSLFTYGTSHPVLRNWFSLTLVSNQGAAFGMLPEASLFFLIFRLIVAALPFFFLGPLRRRPWAFQLAVGLICGGALGNLIDQIFYGAVIDFLHIRFWPGVFNLADSGVVVGSILLALVLLFGERKSKLPKPAG